MKQFLALNIAQSMAINMALSILLFSCLFAGFPTFAADSNKVFMSPYLATQSEKMVVDLWMKDPEYQGYIHEFHMVPIHYTGEADLNDDGVDEILVRHMDDLYQFCSQPDSYTCRAHVYMVRNNQLIEIGRFLAGTDLIVSPDKTNGFHDIMTQNKNRHLTTYIWNGAVYEPKK